MRRALKAYDRGEPTKILDVVGCAWGTATLDELVNLGDSTPGPDFAALAPDIDRLAEEGDAVALGVLQQAAADLVESVLLVRAKLRSKHNISGEVPWPGSAASSANPAWCARNSLPAFAPLLPKCQSFPTKLPGSKAPSGAPNASLTPINRPAGCPQNMPEFGCPRSRF